MMDKKDIERIAHLAQLKLSEEEKIIFTDQLNEVFNHINTFGELDTVDISTQEPTGIDKLLPREDIPREFSREKIMANAPDKDEDSFRVKKVL